MTPHEATRLRRILYAGWVTKLSYDALLWREFRRVKAPEEITG